jgi:hypothetical protein
MKDYGDHKTPEVIRYNWKLLKKYTNNDVHLMLEFFDNVYLRKTENYFYLNPWAAKLVAESRNNAQNFILNVKGLIDAAYTATDSEIFVYLDLASKRSYFTFINTKQKADYLPNWKVDEYDVNALKMNRLLTFDKNNIYLLYETIGD